MTAPQASPSPAAGAALLLTQDEVRARVRVTDTGCWEWVGGRTVDGYGVAKRRGRQAGAHRWSYEAFVGPIPAGMYVCHSCDNPPCVNPDHLWLGTPTDNVQDALRKGRRITLRAERRPTTPLPRVTAKGGNAAKTQCPRCGSTYSTAKDGKRFCYPCKKENSNRAARRRRAEGRHAPRARTQQGYWRVSRAQKEYRCSECRWRTIHPGQPYLSGAEPPWRLGVKRGPWLVIRACLECADEFGLHNSDTRAQLAAQAAAPAAPMNDTTEDDQ